MINSTLGLKIKSLLSEREMTLDALANKSGFTRQGISNIIKTGDTKLSTLKRLAEVLEIDICYFFDSNKVNSGFEQQFKDFFNLKGEKGFWNLTIVMELALKFDSILLQNKEFISLLNSNKMFLQSNVPGEVVIRNSDEEIEISSPLNI